MTDDWANGFKAGVKFAQSHSRSLDAAAAEYLNLRTAVSLAPPVFILWKWRSNYRHIYTAQHVNAMARMIGRHMAGSHRVVCVTDDPEGVECETFPLWSDCAHLINSSGAHMPSCYRRLKIFDPVTQAEMGIAPGQKIISMDLDTVITGPLDALISRDDEFVGWQLKGSYHPKVFNGSMFMLRAGACEFIWSEFDPNKSPLQARQAGYKGSDQSWLSYRMLDPRAGGYDRPGWSKADGVYSYALDLRATGRLTPDARIVMFHGNIKPWHLTHVGKPLWVREYWSEGQMPVVEMPARQMRRRVGGRVVA